MDSTSVPCLADSAAAPGAASSSTAPPARLSKAEKRARKAEEFKLRRVKRRQHVREKHRARVEERRVSRDTDIAGMSPEERAAFEQSDRQMREARYHEVCAQNARVEEALTTGLRVAIDFSYGSLMDLKEQKSLGRQISRCWGANRRAANPLSIHLAGLDGCPATCLPEGDAHLRWKVHNIQTDVTEHFKQEELVFLSPDSPHVLQELDPAKARQP